MKVFIIFCLRPSITGDLLFVSEFIDFIISSKDISASKRLKCSLDIFVLLENLLRNSVVATAEVCLVSEAVVQRYKNGVLKNFANFTGKHLCQSLFLNKVAGLRPQTLFKKRLWHWCFLVKFTKFLRTPVFIEHLRWLILLLLLFFIIFLQF